MDPFPFSSDGTESPEAAVRGGKSSEIEILFLLPNVVKSGGCVSNGNGARKRKSFFSPFVLFFSCRNFATLFSQMVKLFGNCCCNLTERKKSFCRASPENNGVKSRKS